jgi:hypothetical protein
MRWLRLRVRSEVRGDDLSDILRDPGVPRTTFYPRTTALALRVVATSMLVLTLNRPWLPAAIRPTRRADE